MVYYLRILSSEKGFRLLSSRSTLLLLLLSGLVWFALLGHRDVIDPDEARYSEIPREMVVSGDWVTPRLNDLKYFEKPAFQYWMTAISYELFGISNASARLWLAIAGFATALFTGFLAGRLYGRELVPTAFILTLSTLLFTAVGHIITLDMTLTLSMTLAMGSLILAQHYRADSKANRNWMLLGWAAIAMAVLTKGLVGLVLPGTAVFLYMLWQRDWILLKHLHLVKGLILLLLLTVPWFYQVSMANDEFLRFFFIHEHFERYTTDVHERAGPVYYFIGIFLLGACPWLVLNLTALFKPDFSWKAPTQPGFASARLIWVYIATVFIFFSLGHSKLPPYILPIFPFVALLSAAKLRQLERIKGDQWILLGLSTLFLATGIFVTKFASSKIPEALYADYRPWIIAGSACLFAGTGALFRFKMQPMKAIPITGVFCLLGFQMFLWGFQALASSRSSADEAVAIQTRFPQGVKVYAVGNYPQALPFYLNRTVTLVLPGGELTMGATAEPEKTVPSFEAFADLWAQEKEAVAVMEPGTFEHLTSLQVPMEILFQDPRRIVVTKP